MAGQTGGQAVVAALKAHGVDAVFGIPGAHTLAIYDALRDEPGIRNAVARHEGGAGYMADGYARASGRPGVAVVITGPGATNALTAVAGAYADSVPLLLIASQVPTEHLGAGRGFLHEMRDQRGAVGAATDWVRRVSRAAEIGPAIDAAMAHFSGERPTPAYLEIPLDVLEGEAASAAPPSGTGSGVMSTTPSSMLSVAALAEAAELLRNARRPVIYAGWGVVSGGATRELIALAEALGATVATSIKGKGAIPDDHPLCVGCAWAAEVRASPALAEADVMLAVGTRFTLRTGAWGRVPIPPVLIHADIDADAFNRTVPATLTVKGDARAVLARLLALLQAPNGGRPRDPSAWGGNGAEVRDHIDRGVAERSSFVHQALRALRAGLDRDAIVANDNCLFCFWAGRYFPMYEPRTWLFPMQFCTLGYALPAAVGAKVAWPDRQVVALCGDGGFMFSCQELVTAVSLGLNLPVVLFNDAAYGSVRENQTRRYGDRHTAVDLATPDFPRLAEACGARGIRLQQPGDLTGALRAAFAADRPTLIELQVALQFP